MWVGREVLGGERVAVKLLDDPVDGAHEARLLAGVQHPHVVRLRRVSTSPPALVMDLAEGGSVDSLVRVRGPLDPGEVVTVLAPVADALAALHGTGAVHGDVTAANVLLGTDGRPLLADLGAGRLLGTGRSAATAGYAAPEVLSGVAPGPFADVHGLGAVGWFALTGAPPGPVAQRLPLVLLAPGCPEDLVQVLVRAVSPDPQDRPGLAELVELLQAAVAARPVRLVAAAMPSLPAEEAVTHRIRAEALADRDGDSPGRRGRRGRRRLLRGARHSPVSPQDARTRSTPPVGQALTRAAARADRGRAGQARQGAPRRVGAVLARAGLLVAVLFVTGWVVVGPWPSGPGDAVPAAVPPAVPAAAPVDAPTVSTVARAAPSGEPAAVPARPDDPMAQVATQLVADRAAALRAGDAGALTGVYLDGSAARAVDEAALVGGALDVSYTVVQASSLPEQPEVVRLDIVTSLGQGPPTREQVDVRLVEVEGSWRVAEVSEP